MNPESAVATCPRDDENGFTLIEILVVIIIIGILAAIAIPIFLSQQRTARDSATISDVRNLASNVETALVEIPEATGFGLYTGYDVPSATEASVRVYTGAGSAPTKISTRIFFSKTEGTILSISAVPGQAGAYVIKGYNADGQEHTDPSTAVTYESANGGIQ